MLVTLFKELLQSCETAALQIIKMPCGEEVELNSLLIATTVRALSPSPCLTSSIEGKSEFSEN